MSRNIRTRYLEALTYAEPIQQTNSTTSLELFRNLSRAAGARVLEVEVSQVERQSKDKVQARRVSPREAISLLTFPQVNKSANWIQRQHDR